MNFSVISLHSAPRSGSTWLQMIFEAHPQVRTKYQPLFSYEFKNQINETSTSDEFNQFIDQIFYSQNTFLNMQCAYHLDQNNRIPQHKKDEKKIDTLLMKQTHYHYLMETFIKLRSDIKLVCLVRNPCAVINSTMTNPREYKPEWEGTDEWLTGQRKNQSKGDYFGYNKWKEVLDIFIDLKNQYPNNVSIVQYEKLLDDPENEITRLFQFVGLPMVPEIMKFFHESHSLQYTNESTTSVYKDLDVKDKWQSTLDPKIIEYIKQDLSGTKYEAFF